jgi:hypothetical protein
MFTFKQFLLEGGHATEKWNTSRADQSDIKASLKFVSNATGIPVETLTADLLGSTTLTLLGKKKDSGDIDIALSHRESDPEEINKKMLDATNGEGLYNPGTKVGSYAVPVNGKKVQVDLMYVGSKDWAKFSYHSEVGNGSKYPGVVRNIILTTALSMTQEPGKDFVLKDEDGKTIARASKSIKLDHGMERLFKMSKLNAKTGKYNKSLDKAEPSDIDAHLKSIGKSVKFSHDTDLTENPDDVAKFIFGPSVKAKDIMSAENVIVQIKKLKNAKEILAKCKSELTRLKLEIPEEL